MMKIEGAALLWILAGGAVASPACSANNAGTSGAGGAGGSAAAAGAGGTTGAGGATSTGGSSGAAGGGADAGGGGGLPPLTVNGTKLQDPSGKTIILRGSSLIDIGSLYAYGGNSAAGITARLDEVAAAGVQGHVVRLPVYPEIDYNGGYPYCSPLPYPVGTGPSASCTPTTPMTAAD